VDISREEIARIATASADEISRRLAQEGGALYSPTRAGTCYEDAWRFLMNEKEGYLIHGTVLSDGKRIGHAWVETLTGYIWEPETKTFYTRQAFKAIAKPLEENRYAVEQAAIIAARARHLGPWTEEERQGGG